LQLGCVLATEINQELFELEPEDIHLEYILNADRYTFIDLKK